MTLYDKKREVPESLRRYAEERRASEKRKQQNKEDEASVSSSIWKENESAVSSSQRREAPAALRKYAEERRASEQRVQQRSNLANNDLAASKPSDRLSLLTDKQRETIEKFSGRTYTEIDEADTFGEKWDNFWEQAKASKDMGRISQDVNDAYSEYLKNPTEENRAYAEALAQLERDFSTRNADVLDDEDVVWSWISQSAAGYLPQLWDQTKAGAVGALGGGAAGAAVGSVIPGIGTATGAVTGAKAGIVAGVGKYSYDNMKGAAYRGLIEAGVDDETARKAANDEAIISALIEMADTGVDIATLGVGKLLTTLGKGGAKAVAGEAAEGAAKKLLKGLLGYGVNVVGEMGEEAAQEAVSIANKERQEWGATGVGNLAGSAMGVGLGALYSGVSGDENAKENAEQIWEAAAEGGKIAAIMGGATKVGNTALNTAVTAKQGANLRNTGDETVQALVESGLESAPETESHRLAQSIQSKRAAGKTVTAYEVGKLQLANEAAIRAEATETAPETLEDVAREVVARENNVAQAATETAKSVPYNAMSVDNPVRQNAVASKQRSEDYANALGYGEHGRAALQSISEQAEVSMEQANTEFHLPYLRGLSNMEMSEAGITSDTQLKAFNAGRMDRIQSMNLDADKAAFATVHGKESGLVQSAASKKYDKKAVAVLNKASKAFGTKTMLVDEIWQKDGKIVPKGTEGASEADAAMQSNGVMLVSMNAGDPLYTLTKHEFTHRFQQLAPAEYQQYRDAVMQYVVAGDAIAATSTVERYQNRLGLNVNRSADEIAADFSAYLLKDVKEASRFFDSLLDPAKNTAEQVKKNRTMLERFMDAARAFVKKIKQAFGGDKSKMDAAAQEAFGGTVEQLQELEKLWKQAAEASAKAAQKKVESSGEQKQKNTTQESGVAQFKIKTTEDGLKYVQADRQVIFGDDPARWGKQIESFINEQIRKGEDVLFPTSDGHVIALTERSAYKLSDRHKSQIGKKGRALLSDEDFALKGTVAGHIDELIQIGQFKGYDPDRDGSHENDIGEDGFNYFTAFFKDGGDNGGYYRVTFSSAINDGKETGYSIGDIQKRRFPSRNGSSGKTGALSGTRKPSDTSSSTDAGKSQEKTEMQIALEKAMEESAKKYDPDSETGITSQFSMKKDSEGNALTKEQQEYFKDSKVRDENGNLKVMYHGTQRYGFAVFDYNKQKFGLFGNGFYFTDNLSVADGYSKDSDGNLKDGSGVYKVYLNITRPMDMDAYADKERWISTMADVFDEDPKYITGLLEEMITDRSERMNGARESIKNSDMFYIMRQVMYDQQLLDYEAAEMAEGCLRAMGCDGVTHVGGGRYNFGDKTRHRVYIALDQEQIKNVDNKKPTQHPDIRYSLKGQGDLLAENAKLREVNAELREQFKTTKFAKVDKKSLDAFAKKLLKDYQSGADINETRDALDALYTYIANGENGEAPVWQEAHKRAYEVAVSVLENASQLNDDLYQEYSELRKELKTRAIQIDKSLSGDLMGYESIEEFRKANFGRILMSNDGVPVDVYYADLASRYPEFFDEYDHINAADQLLRIAEVLDSLQPTEVNPYSYNMRESATWLANDIMERFFELPQAKPTFADKAQQKLTKQVVKDAKKLEKLREQKNERIAQIIKRERERTGEVRKKEREKRSKAVKQVKEYYLGKQAAGSERRNSAVLRKRIAQHASDLSKKLLRPTDAQHIPENLRTTVAAVLEAINLESQFTIDPVTGKRSKGGGGDPVKRTKAFRKLKDAYSEILKLEGSDLVIDPNLLGNAEEGFTGYFDVVLGMEDTKLADMSLDQLEIVWRVIRAVEKSITTAGKMLASKKFESTVEWANAFEEDTDTKRRLKGSKVEALRLDLENPYTFFAHYGKAGEAVFRMLRDAQDAQQRMVEAVNEEVRKIVDPKQVKQWEKEVHEFKTARGEKLVLTAAHMMEIHELMKREQARDHLTKGGIVQPEIKGKKIHRGTDSILLSLEDIMQIVGKLTQEQVDVADKLQGLMTGILADYGNEASMRAYGYEKFTGTDYFPIKSAKEGVHSNIEKGGNNSRSIKNIGLAKSVIPHASNALDIGGIFSTFAFHAADMADYAAWLCPMEDANRLYNFQFRDEMGQRSGFTMKGLLDRYGGNGAQRYWHRLMEDIQNGISVAEDTESIKYINKAIGNVRAASVGANIRVIVQQPTAFLRAAMVLNPADMVKGMAAAATKGGGWKKALKYSEIAKRKDMGGFDISSPAQMNEILFDSKSNLQKFNDFMMLGAGKADAVTWGKIWNACEWAVKGEGKLETGSEEFYERTAELFAEVIDQSQVVDDVLERSQMMRSSNALAKQATAFMGEPTMALNMMLRAYDGLRNEQDTKKRGAAFKRFGRAAVVLLTTNVVNAFAQSLVDAWRDDDDDEYWEKVMAAFTGLSGEEESPWEKATAVVLSGNVGTSLLPASFIPFVKDLLSILQGYNVTRADADIMADIVSAWQTFAGSTWGEGKKTVANATWNLAKQVGKVFGISAPNMTRDIYGLLRTIALETGNIAAQYELEKWIYQVSNDNSANRFTDILYKAYMEDQDVYQHIYDDMKASGFNMDKIQNRMENNMKRDQNVESVSDLKQRYLHPDQQTEYDRKAAAVQSSHLWKEASGEYRDELEEKLYHLVTDSKTGEELQEKIDGGISYGLSETDYLLYTLALDMYDQPNKSGELGGTPTNVEKAAAIEALGGLSDGAIAYLWDTKSGYEAYAGGVDMGAFVDRIISDESVNVEKLLGAKDVGMTDEEYYDFLDALEAHDKPSKGGNYGSFTQDEAEAAIASISGLTREQRAYLWQSVDSGWKATSNPWK